MELIQRLLEKYNKKVWVMYNSENDDNIFCKYFTRNLATHTICIISKDKVYLTRLEDNKFRLEVNIDNPDIIYCPKNES